MNIKIEFLDVNTTSTAPTFPANRVGKHFLVKEGYFKKCKRVVIMNNGTQVYIDDNGCYYLSSEITSWEVWNSDEK